MFSFEYTKEAKVQHDLINSISKWVYYFNIIENGQFLVYHELRTCQKFLGLVFQTYQEWIEEMEED